MELEKLVPAVGFGIIVIIIATPTIKGIIYNIRTAIKIRKIRSATPGPLLGVVFPPHKTTDKETD